MNNRLNINRLTPPGRPNPQNGKSKGMLPLLFLICFVLIGHSKFWERFYNDPNLDQAEIETAQQEAQKIIDRHGEWVQYVLIATTTMKRPCMRCPGGIPMVTVKAGEIYKYGITTQGESRYTRGLYTQLNLSYFEEYQGKYIECKELEVNKISSYQFLPESQKPEGKLIRPPGNANRG